MNSLDVRDIGAHASIGESSILPNALGLQARCEVSKWIAARIVVVLIASDEAAERKHHRRTDQACPGRRNVECLDLRALIGRPHLNSIGTEPAVVEDHS